MNERVTVGSPTWIGAWAVRAAVVFLGVFMTMLALSFFGFAKADSPFESWSGFSQFLAIGFCVSLLLGIELFVEHRGWIVQEPKQRDPTNIRPPGV